MSFHLSVTTLNMNGVNAPIKRHGMAKWIKKKQQDSTIYCLQEAHFRLMNTHRLQVKGWIFHACGN